MIKWWSTMPCWKSAPDILRRKSTNEPENGRIRNGYKPKTVKTRIGEITFAIPQVREGGFYPSALKKGWEAKEPWPWRCWNVHHGVSTRKVKEITEQLCGIEISAEQSPATAQLIQCCRNGGKAVGRNYLPVSGRPIWKVRKTVKSGMPRFWWPQGSPHGVNVRYWGYRLSLSGMKHTGKPSYRLERSWFHGLFRKGSIL
jgi:hypothetical protein